MYRTRIRTVIWFLFVFVFYIFFDSYFSLFLLASSLIIFLFLGISARIYKKKVQFSIIVPDAVHKQETGECYLEVKSQTFLPIAKVRCSLSMYNSLTGETSEQEVHFSLNGKATERVFIDLKSMFCGNIRIRLEKADCFDLLGVFFITEKPEVTADLLVLPNTFDMELELFENKEKNSEAFAYSLEQAGMNNSEILGIKPYVPGDNVKNIHWKLSGKLDDLMMKELSEAVDYSLLVLLETEGLDRKEAAVSDAMIEAFVSVSKALIENGRTHSIGWFDSKVDDFHIEEVVSMDHLISMVRQILKVERKGREESALSAYFGQSDRLSLSQIIYLTAEQGENRIDAWRTGARVTTLKCASLLDDEESTVDGDGVRFTPDSMKEELRQLII